MFYYDPDDKESHRLFSGPKKPDFRLNYDGHLVPQAEDPFPEDGVHEDEISFGIEDESRIPIIFDGEDEETKDDDIEEDDEELNVTFNDE